MCSSPEGAAVAAGAGLVTQAADALAGARSRPLRIAALKVLTEVASHHVPSRFALRDRLDALHQLVRDAWPPSHAAPPTAGSPRPEAPTALASAAAGPAAEAR